MKFSFESFACSSRSWSVRYSRGFRTAVDDCRELLAARGRRLTHYLLFTYFCVDSKHLNLFNNSCYRRPSNR
ncbi:hypothetical protein KCP74_14235 [Salmonella enterica subsp. enterica]|nr:hypothetical protein KCP74_14235 [Salmonella enterica subsp. enterica]